MDRLTLKDARIQYRNKNKQCRYCEFSTVVEDIDDYWALEKLYCALSEDRATEICEFYQVKEDDI